MGTFTKVLAAIGTLLVWVPIVAPFVFGVSRLLRSGLFRLDYLMPAELFPVALAGAGLLLWASVRARSLRGLFLLGLVLMVVLLAGSQALAVATGLASGETEAAGWPWGLVVSSLIGYTLVLVVLGIAGVLLVRDVFRRGDRRSP